MNEFFILLYVNHHAYHYDHKLRYRLYDTYTYSTQVRVHTYLCTYKIIRFYYIYSNNLRFSCASKCIHTLYILVLFFKV